MREKAMRCVQWLFTPQEIVRSDGLFDVPPIIFPLWWIVDVIFGGPPRLLKLLSDRCAKRRSTMIK